MDQAAACPRCGYDQSGAVAAWEKIEPPACPLDGVCSECGLGFAWVDVLRPGRHIVRGFYEHAGGPWQQAVWALRTLWWAVLPWRFWSRVTLEHAPVPRRILLWPVLVSGVLWAAGSLALNAAYLILITWVWTRRAGMASPPSVELLSTWVWPLASVSAPSLMGPLGWRFDELGWVRGGAPLILAAAAWPVVLGLLSTSRREARVRGWHIARAAAYSLAFVQVMLAVRALDGLCRVAVLGSMAVLGSTPGALLQALPMELADEASPLVWLTFLGWLLLWWYWALQRGFRLDLARTIWALLAVIAVLAAAASLLWLSLYSRPGLW